MAKSKKIQPDKERVLTDYSTAFTSRQLSLTGRKEVLTGKAKFGIFGDGKEVPQLAMARVFREGDWRSGYYRDQTFMFAAGLMSYEEFFSQLYGDTDLSYNPQNAGRLMNNHFASRTLDEKGEWKDLTKHKNVSADISPTAGQMPRLLGLAMASRLYRNNTALSHLTKFSKKGNEIAFGTIGDASTSEGHFWETMNAAGVLQVPLLMSVWDDEYGISVSKRYQTIKESISEALKGFESTPDLKGIRIFRVDGWDYPALCDTYEQAAKICREEHTPVLVHVTGLTQPQGHSTSGSHERYKSKERLAWEAEYDGLRKMREWIISEKIAEENELDEVEQKGVERARQARKNAWEHYQKPNLEKQEEFLKLINITECNCAQTAKIEALKIDVERIAEPIRKDLISSGRKILRLICNSCTNPHNSLKVNVTEWLGKEWQDGHERYSSYLYSRSDQSAMNISGLEAVYGEKSPWLPGREILKANFEQIFEKYPEALIFGEDVGRIGGVNQTLEGMQARFGEDRVIDTGIREATIIGQGIGLAMRGLRPIAEIQYFDYLLYGLQVISDDLATLQYRTRGGQKAPLIISTRGHRLEGIWHSGSPLSMVINSIRGVYVLVPRDMTRAAGFYNTMMQSDEPALIIEPLNGYRLKEQMPENIGEIRQALGVTETLNHGNDITLVTYGSCVRIAMDAIKQLKEFNIECELIDVQSLIPFDIEHNICKSIQRTHKVLFFDEDVPGGATGFMMQKVLEEQGAFRYLDAEPKTLTAKEHRPAYSTDGDYFSNPNAEDVFETVYNSMHEYNPSKYPRIF